LVSFLEEFIAPDFERVALAVTGFVHDALAQVAGDALAAGGGEDVQADELALGAADAGFLIHLDELAGVGEGRAVKLEPAHTYDAAVLLRDPEPIGVGTGEFTEILKVVAVIPGESVIGEDLLNDAGGLGGVFGFARADPDGGEPSGRLLCGIEDGPDLVFVGPGGEGCGVREVAFGKGEDSGLALEEAVVLRLEGGGGEVPGAAGS